MGFKKGRKRKVTDSSSVGNADDPIYIAENVTDLLSLPISKQREEMKREVAEAKGEERRGKQPEDRCERGNTSKERKDLDEETGNLHNPCSSKALLAQAFLGGCNALGTSSRLPFCDVKGDTPLYFPHPESNLAETTFDKLQKGLPSQAQFLISQAGGDVSSPASPSDPSSFNYTEVAQLLEDDGCDEVDSATDRALLTSSGYIVKEEFATLLQSILSKYGDIAKNCHLKSTTNRSWALERLCSIYQNLQKKQFTGITAKEIDSMLVDVEDLATGVNLEVRWFRERLQDISDSLAKSRQYQATKEKMAKYKEDLQAAKEKVHLAKMKLAAILAEGEKNAETLKVTKARMRMFHKSLVAGLL